MCSAMIFIEVLYIRIACNTIFNLLNASVEPFYSILCTLHTLIVDMIYSKYILQANNFIIHLNK